MLIPFGVLSAAGAGGEPVALDSFELIATAFGTGSNSTINFESISQDYKHLQIHFTGASSAATDRDLWLRFNGVSTTVYGWQRVAANGADTVGGGNQITNQIVLGSALLRGDVADQVSAGVINILNYSDSTKNTTVKALFGSAGSTRTIGLYGGLYGETTVVSSINLQPDANFFSSRSRFSLYGIKG